MASEAIDYTVPADEEGFPANVHRLAEKFGLTCYAEPANTYRSCFGLGQPVTRYVLILRGDIFDFPAFKEALRMLY